MVKFNSYVSKRPTKRADMSDLVLIYIRFKRKGSFQINLCCTKLIFAPLQRSYGIATVSVKLDKQIGGDYIVSVT